jgi:hypothetical protein
MRARATCAELEKTVTQISNDYKHITANGQSLCVEEHARKRMNAVCSPVGVSLGRRCHRDKQA